MTFEQIFSRRLRETRESRGWSQAEVSRRVTDLGHRIDQWTVSRIEKGQRKVTLDEAAALAAALGVPFLNLLVGGGEDEIEITPTTPARSAYAAAWMMGLLPLAREDVETYSNNVYFEMLVAQFRDRGLLPGLLDDRPPTPTEREMLKALIERELIRLDAVRAMRFGDPDPDFRQDVDTHVTERLELIEKIEARLRPRKEKE